MLLLLYLACVGPQPASQPLSDAVESVVDVVSPPSYGEVRQGLVADRAALAAEHAAAETDDARAEVISRARNTVLTALVDEIFPRWYGTPWDFYGTSVVPRRGKIACGYFVSTTLLHAGFQVERVRLAQQASEHIIQSFVPERGIQRYSGKPVATVVDGIRREGDGLYLVGLDYHVGYLVNRGGQVDMCHASWLGSGVLCEDAVSAEAMVSNYSVTGKLLNDAMMTDWLQQERIATRTR